MRLKRACARLSQLITIKREWAILQGVGSSIILATAVIEYEDGIQIVPIPKGSK